MQKANGEFYDGTFVDNTFSVGFVKLKRHNGDYYEGNMKKEKYDG